MNLKNAYNLIHSGALALQKSTYSGLRINEDFCKEKFEELTEEIEQLEKEILESDLGKIWIRIADPEEGPKLDSGKELRQVLYDEMGLKPPKFTKGGSGNNDQKGSTDQESLEQLNLPELKKLLAARKLKKMRDTYLGQFMTKSVDGILHPSFSLHTVKTYRSSSSDPNFQNIPKRADRATEICRTSFLPSPGHQFMEIDYSGMEVRIAACVTGDPKLKQDITNGDVHRDMAMKLYRLEDFNKEDKGDKQLRYGAKNGFVFPQFYGSWYKMCVDPILKHAEDVQLRMGCSAWQNLANLGYITLNKHGRIIEDANYYDHVQSIEKEFWGKRYKVYDNWRKKTYARYLSTGGVELPTGFKIYGKAKRNEVLNAPIQGTAFHVLLLAYIMINNERIRRKWRTKMIGQIHDAIIFDVAPEELEEVYSTAKNIMENKVREVWDWITIPLEVEAELFEVDGPWIDGKLYEGV